VVIGATEPAEAAFTRINTNQILGSTARVFLDGGAPTGAQYALLFDLTSNASLDLGFRTKAGAAVIFDTPEGVLTFQDGRMTLNVVDDGVHTLQVGGSALITEVLLGNTLPSAANSAVSKNWVDAQILVVHNSIQPSIAPPVILIASTSWFTMSPNVAIAASIRG
jgi:hypothetical protein